MRARSGGATATSISGALPTIGVAHPQRRVRVLLLGTLMVFSLFAAQLVRLQGLEAASVSAAAFDARFREVVVPAARGTVTDASGQPLAVDVDRVHVVVDPVNVRCYELSETECADPARSASAVRRAATEIAAVSGQDATDLEQIIQTTPGRWGYLFKDATPQTWHQVKALGIPGITGDRHYQRSYPLGESPAPLVGWLGAAEQPAGGVELTRHEELTGTPGSRSNEFGGNDEVIGTGTSVDRPAVPGQDVRLTIDADVQWYAYDAVRRRVEETGALSGYVVVLEVATGALVAAASYPSFDPKDSTLSAGDLRNALVEDVYEPGSTAKLITAAAALETGVVERDTPIVVPNRLPRAGESFKDAHDPKTPYQTFAGVLATSSNMGTILYGERVPAQTLHDLMLAFGLGARSGLGLPGESAGVVPDPTSDDTTNRYTVMFGQGMSSNALQQTGVYQSVANGGVRIPPSIVAGVTGADGVFTPAPTTPGERVIEASTARTLTEILTQVPTEFGTAPLAAIDGYHVAGKTSTADRYDEQRKGYHKTTGSFIGFAPAEDPKYVVNVTIQRPTRISKYGGTVAGPVFADVMRYALTKAGAAPRADPVPEMTLTYDPKAPAPGEPAGTSLEDVAISDEGPDEE